MSLLPRGGPNQSSRNDGGGMGSDAEVGTTKALGRLIAGRSRPRAPWLARRCALDCLC